MAMLIDESSLPSLLLMPGVEGGGVEPVRGELLVEEDELGGLA